MTDSRTIGDRERALLDQLENPGLSAVEIAEIKQKLAILKEQR